MVPALQRRRPPVAALIWDMEFHAWDAASGKHAVLGIEFEALTAAEQEKAVHSNAEILIGVAADMHWSAITAPNGYWHQSPGELPYYVLPGEARFQQLAVLREPAPKDLMLISGAGGIPGAKYPAEVSRKV